MEQWRTVLGADGRDWRDAAVHLGYHGWDAASGDIADGFGSQRRTYQRYSDYGWNVPVYDPGDRQFNAATAGNAAVEHHDYGAIAVQPEVEREPEVGWELARKVAILMKKEDVSAGRAERIAWLSQ